MKKIYFNEKIFNEVIESKKGSVDSNMVLTLINGKKYQLIIAIKFLKVIANNEDTNDESLKGRIISKDEIISKNYELFDEEVIAGDTLYQVEIGYIGTLIS